MRGRVILLLVVLLSLTASLSAQCDQALRYSAQFRNTAYDVALENGLLWLATGYGVTLLEHPAGQTPRVVDSIAVPGVTRVIHAAGNGVAYAGSGSNLVVLRRDGHSLRLVRTIATSGTVNDIAVASSYLFVATAAGIDHFAAFDAEAPVRTTVSLFTTNPNVTSLAIAHSNLYAADGDESVEVFSIGVPSFPQRTGTLEAMPLAAYVSSSASGLLFVSDRFGQNTDVFAGTARIGRYPFGTTAIAGPTGQVYFAAGTDRSVRAIDLSTPSRLVTLFEERLAPAGGSDNAVRALARSGNTLYVAAGDIGLTIYDVSAIAPPYPFVSDRRSGATGVELQGDRVWFSDTEGRVSEQRVVATGLSLEDIRSWSAGTSAVVRDVEGDLLLTTTGASATLWSLSPTTPAPVSSVTFPEPLADAVIHGGGIVAQLTSGAVWRSHPTLQPAALPAMSYVARSGSALAFAEVRSDGSTVLHYYPAGDLGAEPQRFPIAGAAIGGIALDATRAALFTFSGVTVIELANGSKREVPGSTRGIPTQLVFSGDDLLVLEANRLDVYSDAATLSREHSLSIDPVAIAASPAIAVLAGREGTAALSYLTQLPRGAAPFRNRYYTKVVHAGERLYLFSRDSVDIYGLTGDTPAFIAAVDATGLIDIAATGDVLVTLSGNGTVTTWTRTGAQLAQTRLTDATSQPLSVWTAAGAIWVSIEKGCTVGACQKETVVLDSASLGVRASMTGAIDDLTVAGNRAWALVALPDALRAIDLTNPLAPSVAAERPRPPSSSSIAHENGTLHVLGERLYAFAASSLGPTGERLETIPNPAAQTVRITGNCALVMRHGDQPRLYSLPAWTPQTSPMALPSTLRSAASASPRLFLLTEHSLEVWSATAAEPPARRRAVR